MKTKSTSTLEGTKKTKLKEARNTKITKNHKDNEGGLQLFEQPPKTLSSGGSNFVVFVVLRDLRATAFF